MLKIQLSIGIDLYGEPRLAKLLKELCKLDGIRWIRFLYAYPESITDELIDVVKNNEKVCNYFDIPLQHFSDKVLKRMNRKSNSKDITSLIQKLRKEIPDVIIRTTFIVGFPGETEKDFAELYDFVKETKFDKLGAFQYSKEDGTPASRLKEQVHYRTKHKRWDLIMQMQKNISNEKLQEKIDNIYLSIVDEITADNKFAIARSYMDIPDEDGVIFIPNNGKIKVGDFVNCRITGVKDYDLIGEILI